MSSKSLRKSFYRHSQLICPVNRDFSVHNINVLYKESTCHISSLSENDGPYESLNDALTNESHELSPNFTKDYLRNLSFLPKTSRTAASSSFHNTDHC